MLLKAWHKCSCNIERFGLPLLRLDARWYSSRPVTCRKRVDAALKVLKVPSIDVLILRSQPGEPKPGIMEIARGMKVIAHNCWS